MTKRFSLSALWIISTSIHAGVPLWTFVPIGPTQIRVDPTGTATVSYTVANHSTKNHRLILSSDTASGISQVGTCILMGKSATNPTPSCTLTLSIEGQKLPSDYISGGPILCQANNNGSPNPNQCYQPNPSDTLRIRRATPPELSLSSSVLALSVNNTGINPALTGQARELRIINNGGTDVNGLTIIYPTWPIGTTATSNCISTLPAHSYCTVTITPGAISSSDCETTKGLPTPGVITASASNVATVVSSEVFVLSYGCQYQGGFIYSIDDRKPSIESIGGKVASLVDQAEPAFNSGPQSSSIIWSSNGTGRNSSNVSYDIIPYISEFRLSPNYNQASVVFNSTYANTDNNPFPLSSAFKTCNGESDGKCNTDNILVLYNTYNTGYGINSSPYTLSPGPTNPNYYAAGLCTLTINNYSDWFLPSICELNGFAPANCPADAQGMQQTLNSLIGTSSSSCSPPSGTNCLAGYYWSSTEYSSNPEVQAWYQLFNSGGSLPGNDVKGARFGVRCARSLTFN